MRYLDISDIITQLKTDAGITAVLGTRIYERPNPRNTENEAGIFLTIKNLDESGDFVVNNPLLNFIFTGDDRTVTYDELNNVADTVIEYIYLTTNYNGFEIYGTGPLRKFPHGVNKSQRYIQYDLRFNYSK